MHALSRRRRRIAAASVLVWLLCCGGAEVLSTIPVTICFLCMLCSTYSMRYRRSDQAQYSGGATAPLTAHQKTDLKTRN